MNEDLAKSALDGDSEAWNELIKRHRRRVVIGLLARGLRLEDAEDLAQEAWARLLAQQRAGRLPELRLPGLAVAQALWLAKEAERVKARHAAIAGRPVSLQSEPMALEIADPALDPEQSASHRERLMAIETELGRCSIRAQQVFRSIYGADAKSHAEAAREMGLSVQRVRQTLCEVRARLRRVIEAMDKESSS